MVETEFDFFSPGTGWTHRCRNIIEFLWIHLISQPKKVCGTFPLIFKTFCHKTVIQLTKAPTDVSSELQPGRAFLSAVNTKATLKGSDQSTYVWKGKAFMKSFMI